MEMEIMEKEMGLKRLAGIEEASLDASSYFAEKLKLKRPGQWPPYKSFSLFLFVSHS